MKKLAIDNLNEDYEQIKDALNSCLRENEQQFNLINKHNILSATDVDGNIISANENFSKISGYSVDELLGENHRIIKSSYHPKEFYKELWETISSGKTWQGTVCNRHKSGSNYWVKATIVPYFDAKGKVEKYVAIRTDITKTKYNEERLILSQKQAKVGSFDLNVATDKLYWPSHMWKLYPPVSDSEEIPFNTFLTLVHPDDRKMVSDAKNNCINNGIEYDVEHRVILSGGEERWISATGNIHHDSKGQALNILGVSFDITERMKLSNIKKRSLKIQSALGKIFHLALQYISLQETLQQIIDIIIDSSLISTKPAGSIFLVDKSDNTLILEAQKGLHPSLLKQCAKLAFGTCHCGKAAETKEIQFSNCLDHRHEIVFEGIGEHGHYCVPIMLRKKLLGVLNIYLEAGHQPTEDEKEFLLMLGNTLAVVIDRKYAIRSMIEAKKDADFANQAKSEFLANMSHELRTPLSAILGYGQLIQMESTTNLTDSQEENISVIINAGQHLLKLINEILDLAKIEAGQVVVSIKSILIGDIITESLQLITPQAKDHNINVSLSHNGTDISAEELHGLRLYVQADEIKLKQVLLNFLSNAVKYNSLNGKLVLDSQTNSNGTIRISVSDTGIGLDLQQQGELFKPFKRLQDEQYDTEGTGIGLVITKNIIELMKGKVGFESTLGKGSTFWFELPIGNHE